MKTSYRNMIVVLGVSAISIVGNGAVIPPIKLQQKTITVFDVSIGSPQGDPIASPNQTNQISYAGPAGVAVINARANISPNDAQIDVAPLLRWTLDSLPAGSSIQWSQPWPGLQTSGQGQSVTATLSGYPNNNNQFGVKTLRLDVVRNGIVLKTITTKIALFFDRDTVANGRSVPNWFFYWNQTNAGGSNVSFANTQGAFGTTPAMLNWSTYGGSRNTITVDSAVLTPQGDRRRDGSGQNVTGIDLFANTGLNPSPWTG